jgi:hypothetical protein
MTGGTREDVVGRRGGQPRVRGRAPREIGVDPVGAREAARVTVSKRDRCCRASAAMAAAAASGASSPSLSARSA